MVQHYAAAFKAGFSNCRSFRIPVCVERLSWTTAYVNDQALTTVALGLRSFQSQTSTNWGLLMAGSVISMVPNLIIFIFGQKYFLEGAKAGAVKG